MRTTDTLQPALTDLAFNTICVLLIFISSLAISKAQEAVAVNVPEIEKPSGQVPAGQGLREKHITLLKNGELLSDSKPLPPAELGRTVAGASTVFIEADKDTTLGRYIEVQESITKAGVYDIRIITRTKI